ncbi:MAG: hypothetical protein GX883_07695, partial [Firmicutes bacterium]|nr:hypothetical protein [Bacillota bacterium]
TLLLFSIAAQRILRRIPAGLYRTTSFYSMLFILLWMLTGMAKVLVPTPGLTRYLWFATYIARHALPVCWLSMCYVNRHNRLPPRRSLAALTGGALLLTLFVLTNDLHRSVFVYAGEASATWSEDYINGWGYYLSLAWVFILSLAGMALLFDKKRTRQQLRRLLYAGLFFLALLLYQCLYIAGVKHIVDLDIPTTVAMLVLAFVLAAQRERFMGSSLLHLPLFHNSPYAISIFDSAGGEVYKNSLMETLQRQEAALPRPSSAAADFAPLCAGGRVFKPRTYMLDRGRALLLEDITILQQLEQSLKKTHQKLGTLQELLMQQAGETRSLTSRIEQERYTEQMDRLFRNKLAELRRHLHLARRAAAGEQRQKIMRRARFLLSICQQRLRFIIRSLEEHPLLPVQLVESYAAGMISDGGRRGLLDGAATAEARGCCPPVLAGVLLESIDCFCLDLFDSPGRSLICRLEADATGLSLSAFLSTEAEMPPAKRDPLPETLSEAISRLGGRVLWNTDEEGLQIRLIFRYEEVQDDLVHHPGSR